MPMRKLNSLPGLRGLALPLVQAPMAGSQGAALALAVCEAGALGSLPAAMLSAEALALEMEKLTAAGYTYNVNFFCHQPPVPDAAREAAWRVALGPYYAEAGIDPAGIPAGPGRKAFDEESLAVLERFKPPVVSFHFGLPEPRLLARVKAWGGVVWSSATTVDEARWLVQHGADAVIAQGLEAGGHRGHFLDMDLTRQMGTFALLPQVVEAVDVPVIAAGGIATADAVAAAMALGAAGVQPGTAFLLCPESTVSAVHRAALQSDLVRHTALNRLFTGRPARGMMNRVMRELGPLNEVAPEFPLATAAIAPLRAWAEARGLGDFSPLWAGQHASACRAVPAAEVVRTLAEGFSRQG